MLTICQLSSFSSILPVQRARVAPSRRLWCQLAGTAGALPPLPPAPPPRAYSSLLNMTGARPFDRNRMPQTVLGMTPPSLDHEPFSCCVLSRCAAPSLYQSTLPKYLYPDAVPTRSTL